LAFRRLILNMMHHVNFRIGWRTSTIMACFTEKALLRDTCGYLSHQFFHQHCYERIWNDRLMPSAHGQRDAVMDRI
jgi:hypothetical protein